MRQRFKRSTWPILAMWKEEQREVQRTSTHWQWDERRSARSRTSLPWQQRGKGGSWACPDRDQNKSRDDCGRNGLTDQRVDLESLPRAGRTGNGPSNDLEVHRWPAQSPERKEPVSRESECRAPASPEKKEVPRMWQSHQNGCQWLSESPIRFVALALVALSFSLSFVCLSAYIAILFCDSKFDSVIIFEGILFHWVSSKVNLGYLGSGALLAQRHSGPCALLTCRPLATIFCVPNRVPWHITISNGTWLWI